MKVYLDSKEEVLETFELIDSEGKFYITFKLCFNTEIAGNKLFYVFYEIFENENGMVIYDPFRKVIKPSVWVFKHLQKEDICTSLMFKKTKENVLTNPQYQNFKESVINLLQ